MKEDSLQFWIIPIICLVIVGVFFIGVLGYQFNVEFPNAEQELDELYKMSCEQIMIKESTDKYWTVDNREFGREKAKNCIENESVNTGE